jgi:hypothetical protein
LAPDQQVSVANQKLIPWINNGKFVNHASKPQAYRDMNEEVTTYIEKLPAWQVEVCSALRKLIFDTIPDVQERIQYGKPHYLKNGHYAAVLQASKEKVSFMLFNALEVDEIKGFVKSAASPDRKTATITNGMNVDYDLLAVLLKKSSATL